MSYRQKFYKSEDKRDREGIEQRRSYTFRRRGHTDVRRGDHGD